MVKWGFVLVTLYMRPIGILLHVMADKEPVPGGHERFVEPLRKQGVGSTIHCVAGGATGIIVAAVITAALGLPMWLDLIVYVALGGKALAGLRMYLIVLAMGVTYGWREGVFRLQ